MLVTVGIVRIIRRVWDSLGFFSLGELYSYRISKGLSLFSVLYSSAIPSAE
jgi:hypothetical protein